ncbi:MAG: sigma-70 family RNA polymerase sigma factor [Clostridiales bacterium]|nr:sigma-70 family RNA polymerase sigma factor [Clostridiales bacterium]
MDDIVVKKAIKGNKEAYSSLINEIKEKSYRVALCYLRNEHDALDSFSSAVLYSFKHIRKLKNPQYFTTWFTRIIINECKKIIKKNGKIIYYNEIIGNITHEDVYEDIDLKDLLVTLPEVEKMIIYLKYYQGYTLSEISEILQIPLSSIKTKLYRQLQELKKKLQV